MSHSVFKEFPGTTTTTTSRTPKTAGAAASLEQQIITPVSDGRDNVVIVLNKDGSVSVDQHALHTFLRDDTGKTAVSVVRVQSPTPSLEEELREQGPSSDDENSSNDDQPSDASVITDSNSEARNSDEDDSDGGNSVEEEVDSEENSASGARRRGGKQQSNTTNNKAGKRRKNRKQKERPPHVRLTVEQYLAPEQAKIFAAEILQFAGMSSSLSLDVDYDYQRFVVQNDHCYTTLTSPVAGEVPRSNHSQASKQENNNKKGSAPPKETAKAAKKRLAEAKSTPTAVVTSRRGRQIVKPTSKLLEIDSEQEEVVAALEEDLEGVDAGEEGAGDEDYQTEDEDYSASESENDRDSDLDFRVNSNYLPKKKKKNQDKQVAVKAEKQQQSTAAASAKVSHQSASAGSNALANKSLGGGATTAQKQGVTKQRHSATGATGEHKQLQQSKFSFKGNAKGALATIQRQAQDLQHKHRTQQHPVATVTAGSGINSAANVRRERVTGGATASAGQTAPIKQDPLYSDMRNLFASPDIIKKVGGVGGATKGGPSVEVIQLPPELDLDLITSIVEGAEGNMETRKAAANIVTEKSVAADDPLDLNDTSLLDEIVGDDGLPEELLQHVAELVENKSLQEVIDKQVLGVEDPMATLTNLLPKTVPVQQAVVVQHVQPQQKRESPFVKLAQQKQLAKQSAAAAASLTAPRKEPIKIVRSDGRVITLPPIEAPTTRGAKRRAQNNPEASPAASEIVVRVVESPSRTPALGTPTRAVVVGEDTQTVEILSPNHLPETAAPVSARKKSGSERGSTSRRASTTPSVAESDMDMEFNSEDDPDRLWCICKQPHNNRFMICCDTCEDWFHGKCVNITKAMGQQMEAAGKEWTCPNCVQGLSGSEQVCLVCHKKAKPDSVFCSNECILRHANKTQSMQQQSTNPLMMPRPPTAGAIPSGAPRIVSGRAEGAPADGGKVRIGLLKNAQGRVIVYHKKTKQCLSGDSAPFLANIKEWLGANPDYAIVAPGSEVAEAFKAKQAQLQQLKVRQAMQNKQGAGDQSPGAIPVAEKSIQSKLKFGLNKQMVIVHPKTAQQIKVATSGKSSPTTAERTTPLKVARKESTTASASPSTPMGQRQVQRGEVEPIRLTVRKTLKEQLTLRMGEVKEGGGKLSTEEIEQFSLETEQEMFALFNKDTGQKYKAKYRSLIFNIKDRKNETLFKKICERAVKPYRLVRLSPEDLASQELAKWRENENKHQLDMIKKSEMDLLACAKSYVLKSHKGEVEVMESMMGDNAIGTVDDVTMLSGLTKDEGDAEAEGGDGRRNDRKRDRDGKHRSHHSSSTSSSSKHHHKRRRSRERSRERDKDKERSKEKGGSGGGSSSSSKHKSSSSSHSHHSSKEKSSSGGGAKKESSSSSSSSSRHHHHRDKIHTIKEESNHSPSPTSSTNSSSNHKSSSSGGESTIASGQVFKPSKKETEESYDLIEKILQETSPELVAKLHEMEKQKVIEASVIKEPAAGDGPASVETAAASDAMEDEYDPESLHVKGIWSGRVVYQEISQFQGVLQTLYGETAEVLQDFPASFEVQGRIGPDVVWDYLGKIKRSVNRDITVVCFLPRSAKEQAAYDTMYSYFETKGRLGVLKPKSEVIKDFYLVPQKKGKLLPSVLLTLKGLGNYEPNSNCIVGIVVRATLKRPGTGAQSGAPQTKVAKKSSQVAAVVREELQYTPPGSPKVAANKLLAGLPTVVAAAVPRKTDDDDDEPYSPGGTDDEDDPTLNTVPVLASVAPPPPSIVPSELQKEVERLNRQIEAQKNEIVEMLSKDPLEEEEPYSPSRPVSPTSKDKVASIPLANISIPSNLQEILASLKNVGASAAESQHRSVGEEEDEDEEYNPLPISNNTISTEAYKPRPTSPSTRAFLLSQEEPNTEAIPFLTTPSSAGAAASDSGPSKLSYMTDDELMRLVPDGVDLAPPPAASHVRQGELGSDGGIPGLGDGNDEEYDPGQ